MWISMPSSSVCPTEKFFSFDDLGRVAKDIPVLKGRIWGGDERGQGWAIECESFESFRLAVERLRHSIEFFAYDELTLDEETLHLVQDDLSRYALDEGVSGELVNKAFAALRGHEFELFAVLGYAFLSSGRVIFVRTQNELARYVYHPHWLLSKDGISNVRKLKTAADAET